MLTLSSISGSVVECSPATRAARVRFPADATFISICFFPFSMKPKHLAEFGHFYDKKSFLVVFGHILLEKVTFMENVTCVVWNIRNVTHK